MGLKKFGKWGRKWLRSMDPTTKTGQKNWMSGGIMLGPVAAAAGVGGDVDKELAAGRPVDSSDPGWEAKAAGYENSLREVGYDQSVADGYYNQADTGITASQNQAGEQSSESYARRGLGSSGMAASAGTDVTLQAAAARATARQRSIDAATSAKRGSTLDAWGVAAQTKKMDLDYQRWLEEKRLREQAQQDKALSDLAGLAGTVGGFAIGGPAGAAVGSQAGRLV
jgi:hypothetical protein